MLQELLKTRLKLLEDNIHKVNQEAQQAMANLNLLNGAKQECLYWLSNPVVPEVLQRQDEITGMDHIEESKEKSTF